MNSPLFRPVLFAVIALSGTLSDSALVSAPVPVLTRSYNNARTGANTAETRITPGNVAGLHKLRELALDNDDDPRLEAQPLYLPQVQLPGGVIRDLLIVCSMGNNVYAFDANTGAKVWKRGLGRAVEPDPRGNKTANGLQPTEIDIWGINHLWGILSTPVIDPDTNTLYVVNWTSPDGTIGHSGFNLTAVDLLTGTPAQTLAIKAKHGNATFDPHLQKQRSALLLLRSPAGGGIRKTLIMACGLTKETEDAHHGWVVAFDVATFRQTAAWCPTRTGQGGGIWQAGQGPSADEDGFIYAMTSNGDWNGTSNFSESLVKLRYTPPATATGAGKLAMIDWFTPFKDNQRNKPTGGAPDFRDQDFGSGGPILPTGNFVLGAGKDGVLYVLDRHQLGKTVINPAKPNLHDYPALKAALFFTYFPGFNLNPLNIHDLDTLPTGHTHHLHGSALSWDSGAHGTMLFVWGENAALRAWTLQPDGTVQFLAESPETASAFAIRYDAMPGGMITLSANGTHDGIVWGTVPLKGQWQGKDNDADGNKEIVEGILRAYDASAFDPPAGDSPNARLKLLWQSTNPGAPQPGQIRFSFNKFCPPVVADGKVFLTTYDGRVIVYGL